VIASNTFGHIYQTPPATHNGHYFWSKMSAQRKGGWGSFLGSAVAGLESQLDTILAGDDQASARQRAVEAAAKEAAEKQRLQVDQGREVDVQHAGCQAATPDLS